MDFNDKKATRQSMGEALKDLGEINKNIVEYMFERSGDHEYR